MSAFVSSLTLGTGIPGLTITVTSMIEELAFILVQSKPLSSMSTILVALCFHAIPARSCSAQDWLCCPCSFLRIITDSFQTSYLQCQKPNLFNSHLTLKVLLHVKMLYQVLESRSNFSNNISQLGWVMLQLTTPRSLRFIQYPKHSILVCSAGCAFFVGFL